MNKLPRKPRVENKYNIKPGFLKKAKILNREKLKKAPFWRNDVIKAYCLTDGAGKGVYGYMDSYWIGFYDEDAATEINFYCTAYEDMCSYEFKKFYDPKDIDHEVDLELQEKLLERINWLIDEKIISLV
jgi:hypothetical protein